MENREEYDLRDSPKQVETLNAKMQAITEPCTITLILSQEDVKAWY